MNLGTTVGRSVTVFREPQRWMTRIKQQERSLHASFVTCIFANFAADLSGWEWVYSLNHITILCINRGKTDFLGEN